MRKKYLGLFEILTRAFQPETSSFHGVSAEQLEKHIAVNRYGDFLLTDAIRPSMDLRVVPIEGFVLRRDREDSLATDYLVAAISAEKILSVIERLLEELDSVVDLIIAGSHPGIRGYFFREQIDLAVARHHLVVHENSLLNDGCFGISFYCQGAEVELQFDEHKLLVVGARDLRRFSELLESLGIPHRPGLRVITDAEHVHSSSEEFFETFGRILADFGVQPFPPMAKDGEDFSSEG